jgi:hypothetical protein
VDYWSQNSTDYMNWKMILIVFAIVAIGCSRNNDGGATYVSPSIDKNGRFRKGYVRMKTSTDKNANANRNRSRYYYKTRGRYRKKSK